MLLINTIVLDNGGYIYEKSCEDFKRHFITCNRFAWCDYSNSSYTELCKMGRENSPHTRNFIIYSSICVGNVLSNNACYSCSISN